LAQGRVAFPYLGPYAASKHALDALTTALRVEVAPFGVRVALIEPSAVRTPIWERSGRAAGERTAGLTPDQRAAYGRALERMRALAARAERSAIPAERVAEAIVHALEDPHPRVRYTLGRDAPVRLAIDALPARMRDGVLRRLMGTA
jgi:NAD(P)-dependent dehydrogenase (short-subunit alcohol dehydrogenase family)